MNWDQFQKIDVKTPRYCVYSSEDDMKKIFHIDSDWGKENQQKAEVNFLNLVGLENKKLNNVKDSTDDSKEIDRFYQYNPEIHEEYRLRSIQENTKYQTQEH